MFTYLLTNWNTLHTTKTLQTGQATSSLQRPPDLSTSGRLFLLFLYISLIGPHHTMQPQPIGKFVLIQNKTLHNETKLVYFTSMLIHVLSSHLWKFQQLFTFTVEKKRAKLGSPTWCNNRRARRLWVTKHTHFCSKNTPFHTPFRHTSQLIKLLVHIKNKNKNKWIYDLYSATLLKNNFYSSP